jgi:hypothetical protein
MAIIKEWLLRWIRPPLLLSTVPAGTAMVRPCQRISTMHLAGAGVFRCHSLERSFATAQGSPHNLFFPPIRIHDGFVVNSILARLIFLWPLHCLQDTAIRSSGNPDRKIARKDWLWPLHFLFLTLSSLLIVSPPIAITPTARPASFKIGELLPGRPGRCLYHIDRR